MNASVNQSVVCLPTTSFQSVEAWKEPVLEQTISIDQRLHTLYHLIAQHHGVTAQALMQDVLYKCLEEELQGFYQACLARGRAANKRINRIKEHHGL